MDVMKHLLLLAALLAATSAAQTTIPPKITADNTGWVEGIMPNPIYGTWNVPLPKMTTYGKLTGLFISISRYGTAVDKSLRLNVNGKLTTADLCDVTQVHDPSIDEPWSPVMTTVYYHFDALPELPYFRGNPSMHWVIAGSGWVQSVKFLATYQVAI